MRRHFPALVVWFSLSCVCGHAAVTISETPTGVVMENDFLRMTFEPAKGGACTDLFYKPANKQFARPDETALLANRVWNYADQELYRQWEKNPWEHEVRRAAGEVALVLRAAGQVGFTRSTVLEKRITLRDGEAMARIETVFHVGQELMVPQKIGLWFHNMCGIPGERAAAYFPLDDGIVTVDLSTGVGEQWFYNPSRGWAALASENGNGLCFNMEYRRLMCFYLWPGKLPALEWAFRTADIPNGESLRTEGLLLPFAGLRRVHGSANGVAAGFDAPEKAALADAAKGLTVTANLASGAAQSGDLSIELRRLPDGPPQTVFQQAVKLEAGKTFSAGFPVKMDSEGTWALTGRLTSQGKELLDFRTFVILGKESAPIRVAALQERIGRPTERFQDQIAVRGAAPKDVELSMAVGSEHVRWARPYHKGKLRVMVLTSCLNGREAVELAQRMDTEIVWVSAGTQSELSSFSGVFGPGKEFKVEHTNQYIKENLVRPCDVILIGGLRGDLFDDDVINLFRRKVEEGVGLVYVGPNQGPDKLYDLLPVQKETALRRRDGEWRAEVPHFITVGIPFEELPKTDYAELKAKTGAQAKVGNAPLVVAEEGPGKGRVVVLNYNTGWQGNGNWKCGITPWLRNAEQKFGYWEYHFSLLAKSVLWAAKREPDVSLREVSVDVSGPAPKLSIKMDITGGPPVVQAEVKVSDAYGAIEHQETRQVEMKGEIGLGLPENLAGGLHLADVILKADGKVLTWGSAAFRLERGVSVAKVAFDQKAYRPGETARVAVELSPAAADVILRAEFSDSLGRVLAVSEQKATGTASFQVPVGQPFATVLKARVTAMRGGRPLSVAEADAITLPQKFADRAWDDWESCVWGTPAGAYDRDYMIPLRARVFKEYGFTTVLASAQWAFETEFDSAVRAGFQIMPMNVSFGALNVGHKAPKGKIPFDVARTEYQKTRDKKYLVRPTCLNAPADLKDTADKLRKLAEFCGWLEPVGYNLGDEMGTTHYVTPFDYDFGEHCLGVFRDWLKECYKTLDALNRMWETNFASWEQVMPMTALEVKDRRNFAPWADHREFMDWTFAGFFKWVRHTLREKDPRAGVGMSGSQAAEAYGGYDWFQLMHTLDFIQNYTHQDTIAMQRSFDGRVPRVPWYGYQVVNPQMRQFLWRCLLNGSVGGSYFSDSYTFNPDLTMTRSTQDAFEVVAEFQGGLAKLLRHAARGNDIGIHYSHPSIRGAYICGADTLYRDNRGGWVQALQDIGLQCEFLATPQLEAGELVKRVYRAFVLPYSVALTEKEAAALKQYVESGGLLIADAKVGLMDEHCRTLKQARLDDVFGVSRAQVDPLAGPREGEAVLKSGGKLDVNVGEPDLAVAGGEALGQFGQTPVMIVKRRGKGAAVLCNFFLEGYPRRRELRSEGPLRKAVEDLLLLAEARPAVRIASADAPAPRFYIVRYQSGETQYVVVQHDVGNDKKAAAVDATITFPEARTVYDIRKGERLGRTDSARARIEPGDAQAYALLPYEVKGLDVQATRADRVVRYKLSIRTDAQAGPHVFRVEVTGPDGNPRRHYGARLFGAQGAAEGAFHLALNDARGDWTLKVTDIATGTQTSASFALTD